MCIRSRLDPGGGDLLRGGVRGAVGRHVKAIRQIQDLGVKPHPMHKKSPAL